MNKLSAITIGLFLSTILTGQVLNGPVKIAGPVAVGGSFAPFDVGFDIRNTQGFVTDTGVNTYSLGESSLQTRGGASFNWSANLSSGGLGQCRDRSAGGDARLAGICFDSQNGVVFFDVTIAAGTYTVYMALGDQGNNTINKLIIKDTTSVATCSGGSSTITGSPSSNNFVDATSTVLSAASWAVSGGTGLTGCVFSTTHARFYIGDGTNNTAVAYLRLTRTS